MQWLMVALPGWGALQVLVIVGHIAFSAWHGDFKAKDCPPNMNYILCGTPLEALSSETSVLPDLGAEEEEADPGFLSRLIPDSVEGLGRGFAGTLGVLWRIPKFILSVVFFKYELLSDPSFLGLFGVMMQALSWVVAIAALAAVATAISGIIRG